MTLHRDVMAAALVRATGCSAFAARIEAEDLLDALAAAGWRLTDVANRAEQARARRTDPDTSRTAADSVDDLTSRQAGVLHALFERGPMTDAQLVEVYDGLRERFGDVLYPPQAPQGIRTRRSELVAAGHVIDTGRVGLSEYGRPAIVWTAADDRVRATSG